MSASGPLVSNKERKKTKIRNECNPVPYHCLGTVIKKITGGIHCTNLTLNSDVDQDT